jgi:hypothetical protein
MAMARSRSRLSSELAIAGIVAAIENKVADKASKRFMGNSFSIMIG